MLQLFDTLAVMANVYPDFRKMPAHMITEDLMNFSALAQSYGFTMSYEIVQDWLRLPDNISTAIH